MRLSEQTAVPPPPRRLTPASLKRLKKAFRLTPGIAALFVVFGLVWSALWLKIGGGYRDVALELRHAETTGTVGCVEHVALGLHLAYFRFEADGGQWCESYCFTNNADRLPEPDEQVVVQYFPERPTISRIAGMRCGFLLWWINILPLFAYVVVHPVTHLVMRPIRRRRRLCENGLVAVGRLLEPNRLDAFLFRRLRSRGPSPYPALEYSFEDAQGRTRRSRTALRHAPFPLEPGDEVTVIYDQDNPKRSIVVEALGLEFVGEV